MDWGAHWVSVSLLHVCRHTNTHTSASHLTARCNTGESTSADSTEPDYGVHVLLDGKNKYFLSNHHEHPVTAIAVDASHTWLASVSSDALTLWDISNTIRDLRDNVNPCGRRLSLADRHDFGFAESLEPRVVACTFGGRAHRDIVALSTESPGRVLLIAAGTGRVLAILEGHKSRVNQCLLLGAGDVSPAHLFCLTVSEDRTFKIYDVSSQALIYTSPLVSTSPITAATVLRKRDPEPGDHFSLCLGTAGGDVHLFHVRLRAKSKHGPSPGPPAVCRCVHVFDVRDAISPRRRPWQPRRGLDGRRLQPDGGDGSQGAAGSRPVMIGGPRRAGADVTLDSGDESDENGQHEFTCPVLALCQTTALVSTRHTTAAPSRRDGQGLDPAEWNVRPIKAEDEDAGWVWGGWRAEGVVVTSSQGIAVLDLRRLSVGATIPFCAEKSPLPSPIGPIAAAWTREETVAAKSKSSAAPSEAVAPIGPSAPTPVAKRTSRRSRIPRAIGSPKIPKTRPKEPKMEPNQPTKPMKNAESKQTSSQSRKTQPVQSTPQSYITRVMCTVVSALSPTIYTIELSQPERKRLPTDVAAVTHMVQTVSLPQDSRLRNHKFEKPSNTKKPRRRRAGRPRSVARGGVRDQPIVYHKTIRSSGYGSAVPWSTAKKRKNASTAKRRSASATPATSKTIAYPVECGPLDIQQTIHNLPKSQLLHTAPILSAKYSPNGRCLLTRANSGGASVARLPMSRHRGDGRQLSHDAPVTGGGFSTDGKRVVTGDAAGQLRLWNLGGNTEPYLTKSFAKSDNARTPPAQSVGFFRRDRFVAFAMGSRLRLCKYHIDVKAHKDLKRTGSGSKIKTILSTNFEDAKAITCLAYANSYPSRYVVVALSNGALRLYDTHAERVAREVVPAAQPGKSTCKPAHFAAVKESVESVALPISAHDVFLTVSCDDCVRVWDARARGGPAMQLKGHTNRSHPVNAAFSPCMRRLAVGSEDTCAYIYSLRNGRVVSRISGARSVVTGIDFHPLRPQMVTASHDREVRFYTCKELAL